MDSDRISSSEIFNNYDVEVNFTKKESYISTKVKTMESFTEQFRVECVVNESKFESDTNATVAGNDDSIPENDISEKEVEVETVGKEKEPDKASEQEEHVLQTPEEHVHSSSPKPEEILNACNEEPTLPEDKTSIPSVNKLSETNQEDSLYPQVVVKAEVTKKTEAIECKEMRRRGSKQSNCSGSDSRKQSSVSSIIEKDIETILADAQATLKAVEGALFEKDASELRVAVIGAGPAGLCAARHLIAQGIEAEVYEQCSNIGGTWVYSEEPHSGPHVFPLHSSLYHDLWTNLPKETMQYPDFPYREEGYSYLPSEKVLQYLVDYADHFNLHRIIKVKHQVKTVAPLGNSWSVLVEDLSRKQEEVSHFDAVMVCSGPNTIPVYPAIEGIAKYSGKQLHSRDYRRAETYSGKKVLVVGLGPSGLDITYQLEPTAKQVFLSHNMRRKPGIIFPDRVIVKPKVKSLFDKTVTFEDDTEEDVDVIIYCTGYTYNFPFLSEECGLIVDQNVSPLYKHLINIEHPTMCIIGLPKYCPHQYMVDYQVRAFLNVLVGKCKLPPKELMLEDLEGDRKQRVSLGERPKDFHKMGKARTKQYMDDITELGNLEPVAPVMYKIFSDAFMRAIKDFKGFRNYIYKVVDNESFTVIAKDVKEERTIN